MMIIYSPFICRSLHAPIRWDFAVGFSSRQLAGLVPGEQLWRGCPACCPRLPASEKMWFICGDLVCIPLPCLLAAVVGVQGLAQQSTFVLLQQLVPSFQPSLSLLSLAAFTGLVAPTILAGAT